MKGSPESALPGGQSGAPQPADKRDATAPMARCDAPHLLLDGPSAGRAVGTQGSAASRPWLCPCWGRVLRMSSIRLESKDEALGRESRTGRLRLDPRRTHVRYHVPHHGCTAPAGSVRKALASGQKGARLRAVSATSNRGWGGVRCLIARRLVVADHRVATQPVQGFLFIDVDTGRIVGLKNH